MNKLDKIKRAIAYWRFFTPANAAKTDAAQWLPSAELIRLRTDKLKRVLRSATETVPYYRQAGIQIDWHNFTMKELEKFPIVNKEMIRSSPQQFISTKYRGIVSNTSGSTGIPFEFYLPYESAAIEQLTANRAWSMGKEYAYQNGDPIVMIRSYSPKANEPLFKFDKKNNYWYLSPFHINEENLELYLDIIHRSGTRILRGYPSSMYIFTLLLKKKNIRLEQIQSIITSSEMLLPQYRTEIESHFGVSVLDWYGQNENTVTVQQCWAGNYHNNDDYGILEIGGNNNIIATSLNNYVMPFIRYNTNDKAIPLEMPVEACLCGRSFGVPFKAIEGRNDDILIKNDGTLIPTANFSTAMKYFNKLNQFQIIQNEDRSVLLNLVMDDAEEGYIDQIKAEVFQRLGDVKLEVKIVDQIERDQRTGKVKISIQNCKLK